MTKHERRVFGRPTIAVLTVLIALELPAGETVAIESAEAPSGEGAASDVQPKMPANPADAAGELVSCLLPPRIERRGTDLTHLGARREVELSPEACVERGGEVVEGERSRR